MKIKIKLQAVNRGAFNRLPAREIEIEAERVLTNDVTLPWEFNPHNVRLWVVGNEFGALGAVWASHEQDTLDTLVDENLGDSLIVKEEDWAEDDAHLGNAGEPCDLTNVWIQLADLTDCQLLCAFAEARGAGEKNLEK